MKRLFIGLVVLLVCFGVFVQPSRTAQFWTCATDPNNPALGETIILNEGSVQTVQYYAIDPDGKEPNNSLAVKFYRPVPAWATLTMADAEPNLFYDYNLPSPCDSTALIKGRAAGISYTTRLAPPYGSAGTYQLVYEANDTQAQTYKALGVIVKKQNRRPF